MIEYSITIKDEKTKLVDKDISYGPLFIDRDNEDLKSKIAILYNKFLESRDNLKEYDKPDIILKVTMVW